MTSLATTGAEDAGNLPVIDEARLATFTDGNATIEGELGELYVSTALGYLKRMKEAIGEERSWSAEAHALKGASANLGAMRTAALAREAELVPPSRDMADALQAAIDEVKLFFTKREL